ncbi:scavenger receptor class F member 1 [Pristis pectinata]|uniref:scavenger receptor class F member 1 n=1 Tax=Pristis pectinata TaxID=685728 RepID=UPI00223E298F|nr:scavenger receptor class F member 1 [Pristis pectinata]
MGTLFLLVSLCPLLWASVLQPLDPDGVNVCHSGSDLPSLSCCAGWRQQGNDCSIAICDGESTCRQGEVCVRPGECHCPHGYFGANCVTRCPDQFWGPDCREFCSCHPNGRCDPATGRCVCRPGRWGPGCGRRCRCVRGQCEPGSGHCRCEPGWWSADCSRPCLCHQEHSTCDPLTGRCNCSSGFWGKRCNIPCYCGQSPCSQRAGECQCRQGWWGTLCDQQCVCLHGSCRPSDGRCVCHPGYRGHNCGEPCSAGFYGQGCVNRCGRCKEAQPCSPADGSCLVCEAGWTGSRCDQPCPAGSHGERCAEACPRCRDGEPCNAQTGHCRSCDPGWTGPRCDTPCVSGTYGAGCRSPCPECYHGECHHVTGICICDLGYTGDSCNSSCQAGTHGMNCSAACGCLGVSCDHVTGSCHLSTAGVVTTIALLSLLLLLCLLCCCCRGDPDDPTSRVVDDDSTPIARMKHHVQGVLANLGSTIPCLSLGNQKLPKITVLHHDPDLSLNCSFIDSPSAVWDAASFSSFDTDSETPVYCTPPMEDGASPAARDGFPELSSRCNYLPADGWEPGSEERLQPADIPRTSSIAKAKRPSVSFAEGTKFGPELRRGSGSGAEGRPEPGVPGVQAPRKRKLSWRLSRLLPAQAEPAGDDAHPTQGCTQPTQGCTCPPQAPADRQPSPRARPRTGDRRRGSSAARAPEGGGEAPPGEGRAAGGGGEARRWSRGWGAPADGGGSGTVQAMLRRFGSFQRQRAAPRSRGEGALRAAPDNAPPAGGREAPPSPGACGSLGRKPLIPTTPVLRKLVATVAEDGGARLGVVPPPEGGLAEGGQPGPHTAGPAPQDG